MCQTEKTARAGSLFFVFLASKTCAHKGFAAARSFGNAFYILEKEEVGNLLQIIAAQVSAQIQRLVDVRAIGSYFFA